MQRRLLRVAVAAAAAAAGPVAAGPVAAAPPCSPLSLANASAPINVLPPHFATWNVDSTRDRLFFDADLDAPQLRYLAAAMSANHSHIRFGGTGNDFLYYAPTATAPACSPTRPFAYECLNASLWEGLLGLASSAGAQIIFGINIHPATGAPSPPKGPWDPSNARTLLADAKLRGAPIGYLE
jgi:hypothetical protein